MVDVDDDHDDDDDDDDDVIDDVDEDANEVNDPHDVDDDYDNAMETLNLSDYLESIHPLPRSYLENFYKNSKNSDSVYGPHVIDDERLFLGNKALTFGSNGDVIIGNELRYPASEDLYHLLFIKEPVREKYTDLDRENYLDIMKHTGAHLNKAGRIKSSVSEKYRTLISALSKKKSKRNHSGQGLFEKKKKNGQ